ncbi:helix-turn-helix domain-containing protein [Cohnella faecalis]|uniref:Helix-turn-helix domain-containing protein n=1 Tax=Cohnella faecalis TaxID=2315694 RepID=A0A398CP81_9BACL|nr:helix-turn-helix domain-containing protein [Cohnella faecalis]RIE03119.1 helix-turn-helix domain-containing protein [Cohnella faecalis]
MNSVKVGGLIQSLRKEKNMTQNDLALLMNISDKTISKWERGLGCPDISLLNELSTILGVNIEKILSGELQSNDRDSGSMKRVKFYSCKSCGNVMTSTGAINISCCGRILETLQIKKDSGDHDIAVHETEDDYFVTLEHEMSREHYISFAAYVSYDRFMLIKMYPEQNAELRFPKMYGGSLYVNCTQHGLFKHEKIEQRRIVKSEKSIADH